LRRTWESGQKVIKCIGFDTTETHRTYAESSQLEIAPDPELPNFGARYRCVYPLREWGLTRTDCGRIITEAGLPLPPKSACFFCPAMRELEIKLLAQEHPDLYRLAWEMERIYRAGRHFRGDATWSVKARHRETQEKLELVLLGASPGDIREQFRRTHNDTLRPYRWEISLSKAVPGLGRSFAWQHVDLEAKA
jgi:hypothetical protein